MQPLSSLNNRDGFLFVKTGGYINGDNTFKTELHNPDEVSLNQTVYPSPDMSFMKNLRFEYEKKHFARVHPTDFIFDDVSIDFNFTLDLMK